jgi:purine-cytosine permease-like protein
MSTDGPEVKSIDYVTASERHGRVFDQGPFWFLGNFQFFTIAIGFIGPGMHLSLGDTILAGTLGILFGTLFMAFHASQGAQLGLPQMIQSRAQFGYRGVVLVLFGTLFTYVGFNVADTVLSANGLQAVLGWDPQLVGIIIALVAVWLAIYGYDWLHRIFMVCFCISLPLYAILSFEILRGAIGAGPIHASSFTWVAFAAQFAASASYNITYAPYVSDYSRYLPRRTQPRAIIAAVFVGASSSAIWLIALGAWLATRLGGADGLTALNQAGNAVVAGFGVVLSLASVVAMVATMGLNAYSGMLTVLTAIDSIVTIRPTQAWRIATISVLGLLWVLIAHECTGNSITLLFAALTIMLYLLVPWTAINLIDYFLVRRAHYAITDLFTRHGIYGAWGGRGIAAYLLGFAATVPFCVVPDLYMGPMAVRLGGVDIGWLVGLLVAGGSYFCFTRRLDLAREASAIRASEARLAELDEPVRQHAL